MAEDLIRKLEPKALWNCFANLNAVPRGSKKEGEVRKFILDFAKEFHLNTEEDKVGNIIVRKEATMGMSHKKTIVLQAHLDMVHQKNADTDFDFDKQGIQMEIKGDWVQAEGTTLGADNGIGVAAILAILKSNSIAHPNLEALFTVDEESGMTGALGLKGGMLKGEVLLNLDTEDDDEIDIGCAGGIDITATHHYSEISMPNGYKGLLIEIKGLKGGHSGVDIHKGLGNANKLMNRLLYNSYEEFEIVVSEVLGGNLRNVIPRESVAICGVEPASYTELHARLEDWASEIRSELGYAEPGLRILWREVETPEKGMGESQGEVLKALYGSYNGVYAMNPNIPGLVETSNNLAQVKIGHGKVKIACLTRSSVDSAKMDLAISLRSVFELAGCKVEFSGNYPGWTPNPDSKILGIAVSAYDRLYGHRPRIEACHAGLECGILGQHYPNLDMISIGPTIRGAHSPDERVSIASVHKFWDWLLLILEESP